MTFLAFDQCRRKKFDFIVKKITSKNIPVFTKMYLFFCFVNSVVDKSNALEN